MRANGVIDLDQMRESAALPNLQPHDARVFATSALRYDYDPSATCPLWETTIREILPLRGPEDHRVDVLQEFLGYSLLVGDFRFEKFLVLVGSGANGKYSANELAVIDLDSIKKMILVQDPKAFDKKVPVKKKAATKSATKNATPKKVAARKK